MNVIELAQLLTQALDENFNIRNQSAVVKVVTCLEAFNITHESYREVQNTRIIKDLQALRQNKANDQVLAKRIKNLLRKWKERLASSAPSQPNSPQNISQGSSDTQFMTQQSQSPPNSQPTRLVNGPTSFKNLLPKAQNHYQITSPVPQIHQNGVNESSSSQHGVVLGKRKMPSSNTLDGISNASGDIDENSNHNRKTKLMKRSDFCGNSSSIIHNVSNSNSSFLQQNNSQQINNKLHSNVPVTPITHKTQQSQLQQQQPPPQQQQQQKTEEPKKQRGRRKGSKGFDSTLNGNIPDFQAEIQQKIALSAGKRNKTTFELQQMLESHQSTNASWTNGDVHDSNSLDRVNFSASSYNPVEPVYSSFDNLSKVKKEITEIKKEPSEDNHPALPIEDQKSPQIALKNELSSLCSSELTIEDEIAKLNSKLPPIDFEAAIRARFDELNSYDSNGDLVECTCTFREVITYDDDNDEEKSKTNTNNGFDEANNMNSKVNINGDSKNNFSKKPGNDSEMSENDDDDDETDDFCAVEDIILEKSPPRSAVKSIFDPEYDANENLIEEMMVRRKPTRDLPKIIEVKIEKDAVKSSRIESMMNSTTTIDEPTSIQQTERVPIITYVCDENPTCPAREHFKKSPVTKRDVQLLHNSFLNGINGYWNGILEESQEPDYSKDNENIDYAAHQLWKRVVPRYNFLTLDKIPKTFDIDSPFSIPPPPHEPEKTENDSTKDTKKSSLTLNDAMELDSMNKFSIHKHRDIEFREWHEVMNVRSYNDEILTILPYVVID